MAQRGAGRVTSTDVAREAGVARSTVSYVLNQTPHQSIPEPTRRKVMDAAERLGYVPSAAARSLRRGRSDLVLCVLPAGPVGDAAGAFLTELTDAFDAHGLALVVRPGGSHRQRQASVWQEVSPAAVVSLSPLDTAQRSALSAAGVRALTVAFSGVGTTGGVVVRPDEEIGRLQAEHLINAGHRHLGYAGPDAASLEGFASPRQEGVGAACAWAGLQPPRVLEVGVDLAQARRALRAWRGEQPAVTAVCAYNDDIAGALLAAARSEGIRVPDDLAVIGADDIPAAEHFAPALTTVAVDHRLEARRVASAVVAALEGGPATDLPPSSELFRVVQRAST